MHSRRAWAAWLAPLALAAVLAPLAHAQDFGDTPYVQTPLNVVRAMLKTANVGPKDYVVDLGSGDGRMVITAAKEHGARGFGVDHDARLVQLANANAAREGVADRAKFYARDLYKTDVHRATVLSIYLLPEVNLMARPKLLRELKPGTRIVSHDYDMGEWKPDAQFSLPAPGKTVGRDAVSQVFYWVVPANVTGEWLLTLRTPKPQEMTLKLTQKFQLAEGSVEANGANAAMEELKLAGAQLAFKARLPDAAGQVTAYEFAGRVAGDSIEGTLKSDEPGARPVAWRARRVAGKTAIGPEIDPKLSQLKAGSGVQ